MNETQMRPARHDFAALIPAGEQADVTVKVPHTFRPFELDLKTNPAMLMIESIKLDAEENLALPIPAYIFAAESVAVLTLSTASTSIVIRVTNCDRRPRAFAGTWLGTEAP